MSSANLVRQSWSGPRGGGAKADMLGFVVACFRDGSSRLRLHCRPQALHMEEVVCTGLEYDRALAGSASGRP